MPISTDSFFIDAPFDQMAQTLLEDLGSIDAIKALPYDLLSKVMSHSDETRFISKQKPMITLNGIVGPYTVYDEDQCFLYTMNLHPGLFGSTLPELDYISKMPHLKIIFVSYMDSDNLLRNIQVIKKEF